MNLTTWQVDVVMAGASIEPCQRCGARCWVQRLADRVQFVCLDGCGRNGLAIALPTGPNELGWAMEAAP